MSAPSFDPDDHAKNLYIIKCKLADIVIRPNYSFFEYETDGFYIKIDCRPQGGYKTREQAMKDRITFHDPLNVYIYETRTLSDGEVIREAVNLFDDMRFANGPKISRQNAYYSDHYSMSVIELCELIKYMKRVRNLVAFL